MILFIFFFAKKGFVFRYIKNDAKELGHHAMQNDVSGLYYAHGAMGKKHMLSNIMLGNIHAYLRLLRIGG